MNTRRHKKVDGASRRAWLKVADRTPLTDRIHHHVASGGLEQDQSVDAVVSPSIDTSGVRSADARDDQLAFVPASSARELVQCSDVGDADNDIGSPPSTTRPVVATAPEHAQTEPLATPPTIEAIASTGDQQLDDDQQIEIATNAEKKQPTTAAQDNRHREVTKGSSHPIGDTVPDATPAPLSIRELHPFLDNTWILRARVIACGEPIDWSTDRAKGKRLSVYLIDGNGDTIKATLFNDAVNSFLPVVFAGSCCSFANGQIKFANRAFSRDPHDLNFDGRSAIVPAPSDSVSRAPIRSCTPIEEIGKLSNKSSVTLLGVVTRVGPEKRLVTKRGHDTSKRELLVVDQSAAQIVLTLWGAQAKEDITSCLNAPVLIRHAEVSDHSDTRSLNTRPHTAVLFNPALDEVEELMKWFETASTVDFSFVRPPIEG